MPQVCAAFVFNTFKILGEEDAGGSMKNITAQHAHFFFECAQKGMFEVINMIPSASRKITSGHQFKEEDGSKD